MNEDIFKGNWKQFKGNAKQWWGKLTDDDLSYIEGRQEELIGKLQERYGWSKEDARAEVNRRLNEYERSL
jgi:uncharacterized protein YjbJ (UPF0337 family)